MKTNVFSALFIFILSALASAQQHSWQPEGSKVTYGTPGKGLWHIGVNADNPETARREQASQLNDLFRQKVHPFQWGKHFTDEVVWHIHGTAEALNEELGKVDPQNRPSWVWETAPKGIPCVLYVRLTPSGKGWFQLFQNKQIIAEGQCVSANKVTPDSQKIIENSQPLVASYTVCSKEIVHINHDGLPMKWAMLIDPKRRIFLHSRIQKPSHGCIGFTVPMIAYLYERMPKGTVVSISAAESL